MLLRSSTAHAASPSTVPHKSSFAFILPPIFTNQIPTVIILGISGSVDFLGG
jgi:hypothetical protein